MAAETGRARDTDHPRGLLPSVERGADADGAPVRGAEQPLDSEALEEQVARGESGATPFLVLGGLAFTIWLTVAVVAGGALLLWWLL